MRAFTNFSLRYDLCFSLLCGKCKSLFSYRHSISYTIPLQVYSSCIITDSTYSILNHRQSRAINATRTIYNNNKKCFALFSSTLSVFSCLKFTQRKTFFIHRMLNCFFTTIPLWQKKQTLYILVLCKSCI